MYNYWDVEQQGRLHQEEMLAEAEYLRLLSRAARLRHPRIYAFALLLLQLGGTLIKWGTQLQKQYDTPATKDRRQYTT
jgi:hypothetical protein